MSTRTKMTVQEALAHGYKLQTAGNALGAAEIYAQVIATKPTSAEAWCYMGMAYHDLSRYRESEDAYRRALALRPQFSVVLNNLGNTLRMRGRTDEAIEAFDEAIRAKPGYLNAIRNRATALYWAGRFREAEEGFLEVLGQDPEDAEARKDLGVLRLLTGKFREGWADYEYRWKVGGTQLPRLGGARWEGEDISGRTLMLVAEQGLGDTIQFVRYGRLLSERFGCRVVAQVQDVLVQLLSGSAELMGLELIVGKSVPPPEFDYWVPMLSLPGVLDQGAADIPYNGPYLDDGDGGGGSLDDYEGLKVGIAWQGNPANQGDGVRSFPVWAMAALARLNGVTLFSLQKGVGADQVGDFGEALGLVNLGPGLDEGGGAFLDSVAVMKELDLVICADTAVAHVAGALGVPIWLALPFVPDWRWGLDSESTPWYPTMRLFRQRDAGRWEPVFEEMAEELARLKKRAELREIPDVPSVTIPISPGELVDRVTILEVKKERIGDGEKLRHVRTELAELTRVWKSELGGRDAEIGVLAIRLKAIHARLWDAEDAVRKMESEGDFSETFVKTARSIYRMNDKRAELKTRLNDLLGAAWQEAKSHKKRR